MRKLGVAPNQRAKDKTTYYFTLDKQLKADALARANADGVSLSSVLVKALEEYVRANP